MRMRFEQDGQSEKLIGGTRMQPGYDRENEVLPQSAKAMNSASSDVCPSNQRLSF